MRIVHEEAPTEELAAPLISGALRVVGRALADVIIGWLLDALKRELEARYDRLVAEFERAVQSDGDGVTLIVTLEAPPVLEPLRQLLKSSGVVATARAAAAIAAMARQAIASVRVELRPGFAKV